MRIAFIALLFALAVLPAEAQERVRFGAKLGVTSSELWYGLGGGGSIGLEGRFGLNAGIFATVPVRGDVSALLAADYYRKGHVFRGELRDENNLSLGTDPDHQYDYASLTIAPQYAASLGSSETVFYAFAGPRLDLLFGSHILADLGGERVEIDRSFFLDGQFNTFVLGATAGTGIDLSNRLAVPLLFELRYDADVTAANPRGDQRFRTFSFRLGFSF